MDICPGRAFLPMGAPNFTPKTPKGGLVDRIQVRDELGKLRVVKKLPGWYIGSKSRLLEWIWACIQKRGLRFDSMLDGFAGSSTVGYFFKQMGKRVMSVDMTSYAYQIAKALIENNSTKVTGGDRLVLFGKREHGDFMEKQLGSIMLRSREARFLDELRTGIDVLTDDYKKAVCYYSIITTLYSHAAYGQLQLPRPGTAKNSYVTAEREKLFSLKWDFIKALNETNGLICDNGKVNKAFQGNTIELVKDIDVDMVYWDPPYAGSANDYEATYRILECLISFAYTNKRPTPFLGKSLDGFEALFTNASHIPMWVLAYYENDTLPHTKIADLMRKFKKNVSIESKEVDYPSRSGRTKDRKAIEIMIFGY